MVQIVSECLGVGVVVLVEAHGIPSVLAPILPVLHQHAYGDALLLEAVGGLQDLVGRVEALTAVDIAQRPRRHRCTGARQFTIGSYYLVGRTDEYSVVHLGSHRRAERRLVLHQMVIEYRLVISSKL